VPPQSVGRLANELKARGRDVLLIHREEGGHSTTYDDTRAILEFVIQEASPATGLALCDPSGSEQTVNVASPIWGTLITATSAYSDAHAAANVADGSVEEGRGWLSADNAALPQTVTFNFAEPFPITQARVRQVKWTASMYRTKEFRVEGSADGKTFRPIASGTLADNAEAEWSQPLTNGALRAVRIVILSSYTAIQTCGLGEVELLALLPEGRKPMFSSVSPAISWRTLRGMFKLSLDLDPPASLWCAETNGSQAPLCGKYASGPYELTTEQTSPSAAARIIRWRIRRTDGHAFKLRGYSVECKTSYSGVYKILEPGSLTQQNYKVDMPFRIAGGARAEIDQPVIWMQQTDGRNTLTAGLLDQVPPTGYDGSTYDPGNGGESPGIANSYVRVVFNRLSPKAASAPEFTEALYVNADPNATWFEALEGYGAAVDAARGFKTRRISDWAFNPMWHSWYAHGDKIDEERIRSDARLSRALGATTIELDAGWNIPRGVDYAFETEGDYRFDSGRFPNPKGMINEMHAAGQRVILHVAPLVVGNKSKAWERMKDCMIMVNGKPDAHLDPRLKKVHDHLLAAWEYMFTEYAIDGLWYDFLEIPDHVDAPAAGMEVVSPDLHVAYTQLMQALFNKSLALNSNAVTILRRASANLNSKTYCTHVWPMDTPQDYNMNRRDIVYMKSFGPGVLTHACCTSWAISESDVNVARQMASMALAGVPAFSFKLAESPASHNAIVKAWLAFYEANSRDLVLGRMIPLLPTPPSAALRIEGEKQAFFGFFEAVPGLVEVTKPMEKITLVNAFSQRTATRLEGVKGKWQAQVFEQTWKPLKKTELKADAQGGLNLNFTGPTECHTIVLTKKL
jgi:hypothetical protein